MRLTRALRRLAQEATMLAVEWARHGKGRSFAYAAIGAAAAVLIAVWAFDASGMAITDRPSIQRATTW